MATTSLASIILMALGYCWLGFMLGLLVGWRLECWRHERKRAQELKRCQQLYHEQNYIDNADMVVSCRTGAAEEPGPHDDRWRAK